MAKGILVGYGRVSSIGQKLQTQRERLEKQGCTKIFQETYSGASSDRKQLRAALDFVREGDSLIVTKLDRLARSATDLGNISAELQQKKVDLVVLDQKIDTSTATGKLMFNMIGAFAEFERDLISERCREGIDKAKKKGIRFGRSPKLTGKQLKELKVEFQAGIIEKTELAKKFGISRTSVYRLAKAPIAN